MGRKSKSYKHDTCECNTPDNTNGCEACTCCACGDWLETKDSDTCSSCVEEEEREFNELN